MDNTFLEYMLLKYFCRIKPVYYELKPEEWETFFTQSFFLCWTMVVIALLYLGRFSSRGDQNELHNLFRHYVFSIKNTIGHVKIDPLFLLFWTFFFHNIFFKIGSKLHTNSFEKNIMKKIIQSCLPCSSEHLRALLAARGDHHHIPVRVPE